MTNIIDDAAQLIGIKGSFKNSLFLSVALQHLTHRGPITIMKEIRDGVTGYSASCWDDCDNFYEVDGYESITLAMAGLVLKILNGDEKSVACDRL